MMLRLRFNCTFMELKLSHFLHINNLLLVLIVPLWN